MEQIRAYLHCSLREYLPTMKLSHVNVPAEEDGLVWPPACCLLSLPAGVARGGCPSDYVVEKTHILSEPCHEIILPVENACGHEGIVVCSNRVKAVVDRKVRQSSSVFDEYFMKSHGHL